MATSRVIPLPSYSNYLQSDAAYKNAKKSVTEKYTCVGRLDTWAGSNSLKKICAAVVYIFAAAHDYVKRDAIQDKIYRATFYSHKNALIDTPGGEYQQHLYVSGGHWEKATIASSLVANRSHTYLEEEACKHIETTYGLKNVILSQNLRHPDNKKSIANEVTNVTQSYTINVKNENGELVPLGELRLNAQFDHGYQEGALTFDCLNWNASELSKAQKVSDSFSLKKVSGDIIRNRWGGKVPPKVDVLSDMAKGCIESRYKIKCDIDSIQYGEALDEDAGENLDLDYCKYRAFSCDIRDPDTHKVIGRLKATSSFDYEPVKSGSKQSAEIGSEEERVPLIGNAKLKYATVDFEVTFDNRARLKELQKDFQDKQVSQLVYDMLGIVEEPKTSAPSILHRDFSALIPKAEKQIQKTHKLDKVQLTDKGPLKIRTEKDKLGKEYFVYEKEFQVIAEGEIDIGTVTIERNFNPNSKDTVTFKYNIDVDDIDHDAELP